MGAACAEGWRAAKQTKLRMNGRAAAPGTWPDSGRGCLGWCARRARRGGQCFKGKEEQALQGVRGWGEGHGRGWGRVVVASGRLGRGEEAGGGGVEPASAVTGGGCNL